MTKGKVFGVGALFGAIGATYKVGEFMVKTRKLLDVGEENAVFERLILRVRRDLIELQRLLQLPEVQQHLARLPEKARWLETVIRDTNFALTEMSEFTRNVTEDTKDGSSVGIRNRIRWVLDEQEGLTHRRLEVDTCHQTMIQALDYLAPLERPDKAAARYHQQQLPQRNQQYIESTRVENYRPLQIQQRQQYQQYPQSQSIQYEQRRVAGPGREERPGGGHEERVRVYEERPRGAEEQRSSGEYSERVEVTERRARNETGGSPYDNVVYRESQSEYYPDPRPMRMRTSKL